MEDTNIKTSKHRLDFFDTFEEVLTHCAPALIDHNLFLPISICEVYDNVNYRTLSDYLFDSELDHSQIRKVTKQIKSFQKEWFKKLSYLLQTYPNLTTIDEVITQMQKSKDWSLIASQNLEAGYSIHRKKSPRTFNLFRYLSDIKKVQFNGLDKSIYTISDGRQIFCEECLGNPQEYDMIFSLLYKNSKRLKIPLNEPHIAQHLITTAFYISSLNMVRTDIFTGNPHLVALFNDSNPLLSERLEHISYKPEVYVHMVHNNEDNLEMRTFK